MNKLTRYNNPLTPLRQIGAGLLVAASLAMVAPSAMAEKLAVPVASQAAENSNIARPGNGMTGTAVVSQFGEPMAINSPVGEPPISRWEYGDFYVYFEYNRVIHSVLKHRPKG